MPEFEFIAWIGNLTPPATPLAIADVVVARPSYGHTLDDDTVQRVARAGGLSITQTTELRQAVKIREKMVVETEMRVRTDAPDQDTAFRKLLFHVQRLLAAIEIITQRPVDLTGWAVGEPAGGLFFPVRYETGYTLGKASIEPAAAPVLEELVRTLQASFPQRIGTALVEFNTTLRSVEVRRQIIHAVVVLEALFGDSSTEALSYKVPLRAAQLIPSLARNKRAGYQMLRDAYDSRSRFVHGTWTDKTLTEAIRLIDQVLPLTAEALQEFLFRARDGKVVAFPELDAELFF